MTPPPAAAPFVKWAGGKRALAAQLATRFPERIGTWWEPFVGGGSMFFALAHRMERAVLADANKELMTAYRVVKGRVDALIAALREHERRHHADSGHYLRVRAEEPSDAVEVAARFIYLNKTCFNGLYRVNSKGKFNVPQGRYKNPAICDEARLRAASKALAKATIRCGDFERTTHPASGDGDGDGDVVYCDPPYDECFAAYNSAGFDAAAQERLRDAARRWTAAGALVVVSNSDTALMRRLYGGDGFVRGKIASRRVINCRADGRGAVGELVITARG